MPRLLRNNLEIAYSIVFVKKTGLVQYNKQFYESFNILVNKLYDVHFTTKIEFEFKRADTDNKEE